MKLKDVLTIDFLDLPLEAMRRAGEVLCRDGSSVSDTWGPVCGKPVFARADADAVSTSRLVVGRDIQFLAVVDERRRLLGLVDAATLKKLSSRVVPSIAH